MIQIGFCDDDLSILSELRVLLARYRYLLSRARELGLHTILQKYQPLG